MTTNSSWTEPVIVDQNNPPKYPYNQIQQSESGHSIELDDSPSKERVRIQHRSGTFTEMQPNGDEVHKIYGDGYEIVLGGKNVQISGQCNITIDGACVVHIKGDSIMQVDGNVTQKVSGDVTQTVSGTTTIAGDGDIDIASSGDISLSAQSVNIDADLNVNGGITSTQSISAVGNVEAGLQCFATLGMVTPGYISAGSPVALNPIPGWVSGIMVTDIVRTLVMDRLIYDTHTHPVLSKDFGITGVPTQPM
jgi:hypothetical protein